MPSARSSFAALVILAFIAPFTAAPGLTQGTAPVSTAAPLVTARPVYLVPESAPSNPPTRTCPSDSIPVYFNGARYANAATTTTASTTPPPLGFPGVPALPGALPPAPPPPAITPGAAATPTPPPLDEANNATSDVSKWLPQAWQRFHGERQLVSDRGERKRHVNCRYLDGCNRRYVRGKRNAANGGQNPPTGR